MQMRILRCTIPKARKALKIFFLRFSIVSSLRYFFLGSSYLHLYATVIGELRNKRVDVSDNDAILPRPLARQDDPPRSHDLRNRDDGCDLRSALHPCATMAAQKLHTLIYGRRKREVHSFAFLTFGLQLPYL